MCSKKFRKRIKERRMRKMFECPYDLESCGYVDTLSMTKDMECKDCPRYDHGVRPTGGIIDMKRYCKLEKEFGIYLNG